MIIGIDHGYHSVKTRNFVFPAGIVPYEHEPYTMKGVLEYENRFYVCGSGRQPLIRSKTSNDNYYLLTLAAIAKELKKRGKLQASITLAAGLPLAGFGREKCSFRQYLLRSQPVKYCFEGQSYEITIESVHLYPQGFSAIAIQPEALEGEPSVLLVDIGGWTVDIMRLDNSVPNAATCRSLELGVIRCIDETLEQVRRNTGLSVTDIQVERLLNGNNCSMDEQAKEIVLEQGRIYIQKLLSAVMESGYDLKAVPVIFMGGGASIIKRFIIPDDRLCRTTFITDVHANAVGFERIAAQREGK